MTFILDRDTGKPLRASICTKVMRKALCALEIAMLACLEAGGRSIAYTKKLHKYARAINMISNIIIGRENWNHNLWVRAKSRRDKVFRAMIRAEIGQKAIRAWHLREEKAEGFHTGSATNSINPNSSSCHPGPHPGYQCLPQTTRSRHGGHPKSTSCGARDDSNGGDAPAYEWKPYGLFPQAGLAPTRSGAINPGSGSPRPRTKRSWIPALFYPYQLEPSFDPPPEDDEPVSGGSDEYELDDDEGTQSRVLDKPDPAPP